MSVRDEPRGVNAHGRWCRRVGIQQTQTDLGGLVEVDVHGAIGDVEANLWRGERDVCLSVYMRVYIVWADISASVRVHVCQ